jgi:hypothetical protein
MSYDPAFKASMLVEAMRERLVQKTRSERAMSWLCVGPWPTAPPTVRLVVDPTLGTWLALCPHRIAIV